MHCDRTSTITHIPTSVCILLLLIPAGCQHETTIPFEQGSISVHFCPEEDCISILADFIQDSEGCAFYDVNHPKIVQAIKDADIELLVDSSTHEGLGKQIWSRGLMHNKYCYNKTSVLTGSYNPTGGGLTNRNNIVIIKSELIAENYAREQEELKKGVQKKVENPVVNLSGVIVKNYFCPEDDCELHVLEELAKAEESIYFMTYSFTSDAIGNFISESDVEVIGLMEPQQISKWSEHDKMKSAGHDIIVDEEKGMLHHKVFIIDGKTVITGSYNPSKNGNENNDENIIIIHDENIARQYADELDRQLNQNYKKSLLET